ncbi:hypothetical protein Adt_13691 [Abeliophyllum distichum]|uniref:Arrestin-like N-terminal domain-containing protein n=1 Tax=Abeliophyllum distichum TaxID=126358 RepID=A0ABD1TXJ1_9LAMI
MTKLIGPLCPKIHVKLVNNIGIDAGSLVDWSEGHSSIYGAGMGKLQYRISYKLASTATPEPPPSEFHFMPFPGIMPANSDLYDKSKPAPDVHLTGMENALAPDLINEVQTQSFSFDKW